MRAGDVGGLCFDERVTAIEFDIGAGGSVFASTVLGGLPSYFTDPEDGADRCAGRREAIDHILAALARSPWSPRPVLRGDALARAWFGEWVPEPECLEFVVRFEEWQRPDDPSVDEVIENVLADAAAISRQPGSTVVIDRRRHEHEAFYEDYDSPPASAQQAVYWRGRGQLDAVRMYFAFEEILHDPPVPTLIPRANPSDSPLVLQAVSRRQSLAWKIARLAADSGRIVQPWDYSCDAEPDYDKPVEIMPDYDESVENDPIENDELRPKGRDLYEAVLLAEHSPLPLTLIDKILGAGNILLTALDTELDLLVRIANDVDWNAFAGDYPALGGAHEQFVWWFVAALAPTFRSGPSQLLSQLTDHCRHELPVLRGVRDSGGMAAVGRWFSDSGHSIAERVVLVRELLGANRTPAEVADLVAAMPYPRIPGGRTDPHRVAHLLLPPAGA